MKIRVTFDYPPIPVRSMDYSAHDENRLDGAPDAGIRSQRQGYGRSRLAAIRELAEQTVDDYTEQEVEQAAREATDANDADTLLFCMDLRELWKGVTV